MTSACNIHPIQPAPPAPGPVAQDQKHRSVVWLRGQPHLEDYLAFHEKKVIGGETADLRALAARWRESNDLYYDLAQEEAGIADTIACRPLDATLAPLAAALEANDWFQSSFDNLPYTIELVELDKLVVSQIQVEDGYSVQIAQRLGKTPDPADLFRFCLPLERELAPVEIRRLSSDIYQFVSPSSDFRAHDVTLLRGEALAGMKQAGPVAAMVGICVGFGSNFLSAIRSNNRLLLQNGYHRAYALRQAGFTHAWCVIEHVTRKDDLRLTATGEVLEDPEFYFAAKRPPILRDFFDPRIAERMIARAAECLVEVEIKVRSTSSTRI
jgi:hypothetical protein